MKNVVRSLSSLRLLWFFPPYYLCTILLPVGCLFLVARQTQYKAWMILFLLATILANILFSIIVFSRILLPLSNMLEETAKGGHSTLPKTNSFHDSLYWIGDYYQNALNIEYSAQLLQKQAEIDFLQNQINPHFLYNTLDSVRGLALQEDAEETSDMVESLSRFLRYSISQKNDMISLGEELDSVTNYMKIQKHRFADRFDLVINYAPDDAYVLKYKIPKLTLQPIIENAIYHGLDQTNTNGLITIDCMITQSRLIILVEDNGKGMPTEKLAQLNDSLRNLQLEREYMAKKQYKGLALHNVNARIKLIYGEQYGLSIYSMPNIGTQVEMILPLLEDAYEI